VDSDDDHLVDEVPDENDNPMDKDLKTIQDMSHTEEDQEDCLIN